MFSKFLLKIHLTTAVGEAWP